MAIDNQARSTRVQPQSRRVRAVLWTIQAVLALLFLFAGGMKLAMPLAELANQGPLPGGFLRFIGACEVLGAVGLIVPGIAGIRRGLTPLAAIGLVLIMIGATVVTLQAGQGAVAAVPFVVGLLAAVVAHGRRHWAQPAAAARRGAGQPSSV